MEVLDEHEFSVYHGIICAGIIASPLLMTFRNTCLNMLHGSSETSEVIDVGILADSRRLTFHPW